MDPVLISLRWLVCRQCFGSKAIRPRLIDSLLGMVQPRQNLEMGYAPRPRFYDSMLGSANPR